MLLQQSTELSGQRMHLGGSILREGLILINVPIGEDVYPFGGWHQPAIQFVQVGPRRLWRYPDCGRKQEQAAHPAIAQALVNAQRAANGVSCQIDLIYFFGKFVSTIGDSLGPLLPGYFKQIAGLRAMARQQYDHDAETILLEERSQVTHHIRGAGQAMREQYAATIGFLLPGRETGWRLRFERRIAIDYFFQIGSTGVCPPEHVAIARHIIRKRQPVSIELRVQPGRTVPCLKRRSRHSYSPAHFAMAASVSSSRQCLRSKFFALSGLSLAGLLAVGLLAVWPDWDVVFAVLIVLASFNGGCKAWAGAATGGVAAGAIA